LIPLKDDNPRELTPWFNYALILCNVAVFIYQYSRPDPHAFVHAYGAIPDKILHSVNLSSLSKLLTAMFLHDGGEHLFLNMLYLWIFGDNVEDRMGHLRYLAFYLLTGIAATLSYVATMPASTEPMIGASGAISGVLGAYLVKFPHARILIFVPFILLYRVPALIMLGLWFINQLTQAILHVSFIELIFILVLWILNQLTLLRLEFFNQFIRRLLTLGLADTHGVAWFAHIGGFVAGLLFVKFFERRQNLELFRRRDSEDDTA